MRLRNIARATRALLQISVIVPVILVLPFLASFSYAREGEVSGIVTLDPSARSRLPSPPLLIITVSKSKDPKKPPIIVKRIPNATFPYEYTLSDEDITLVGSTFDGDLYVNARVDLQNASEGTLEGSYARSPVAVGSSGVNIGISFQPKGKLSTGSSTSTVAGAKRLFKIGLLWSGSTPFDPWSVPDGLRKAFRERGYVEGQNIVFEPRYAEGNYNSLPKLASELVELKVDVILAAGDSAAVQAARDATTTIPVVMIAFADAVQLQLVDSLAKPGGNITGLSVPILRLAVKQLELLKQSVPGILRAAVLWNPENPAHALVLKEIQTSVRPLRIELEPITIRSPSSFREAFAKMVQTRADSVLVLWDPMLNAHGGQLTLLAMEHRLPTVSTYGEFAEASGLLTYGPRLVDMFNGGASYVDKLIRGAKPADLPVEQPSRFDLTINTTTAKVLGLTIPQSILIRSDRVVH